MAKRPPNIIVYMDDQEQAQVCHPSHPCKKPTVTKLAKEGLLFNRCYTPSAHSCPARASYFTGTYPSRHGVWNNVLHAPAINRTFDPSLKMFSETMRAAGWNLGITGKWHCSAVEGPEDRGWEDVNATATADNPTDARKYWERWLRLKPAPDGERQRGEVRRPGYPFWKLYGVSDGKLENSSDYKVVTKAIEAMERYAKEDKPFFIHCGPTGPHDPYLIPEQYANIHDPKNIELPKSYTDKMEDKPTIYQRQRALFDQLSEDETRESIAFYWGYCSMMDHLFSLLYEAIDSLGIRDNTLLIYTSDHGDYCAAHNLYAKGIPAFDEGYRVPMIVRWPEGIEKPGREIDEFVNFSDFAPTFLDVAGLEQNQTDGASFAPFFKSSDVENWTEEFTGQMNGVEYYFTQRFIQTKEWKFVYNPTSVDELYDLKNDPDEIHNLALNSDYENVKRDMMIRLWKSAWDKDDPVGVPYITMRLAPHGPLDMVDAYNLRKD